MKTSACLFAATVLFLGGTGYASIARANDLMQSLGLRTTISADDALLSTHINERHQWELRSSSADIAGNSLVAEIRPTKDAGAGLTNYLGNTLERSDALRSTLFQSNAAHQAVKTATFDLLPTLSIVGEYDRDTSRRIGLRSNQDIDEESTELQAEWNVYSGGANWAAVRASYYSAEAADWEYLATERQTFLSHSGVYLQAVSAQKVIGAISNTLRRLKRIRHSTQKQYQAGFAAKTDIAQVDAEIASVTSQLEGAKLTLEQQRIAYRDLVGQEAPAKLVDPSVGHLIPDNKQAAIDRALQSNHTINAADANYNAAVENSNVAKGRLLPQVSLFATGSKREEASINTDREYDWSAGIRVNVPLVNLADNSRFHEARARAISADFLARDTRRAIKQDVEVSWATYHSLSRQHNALRKEANAIRSSLIGIEKQVEIGLRSISDLLREEIRLTQSEIQSIRTRQDMKFTALRLAIQFSDLKLNDIAPVS